MSKCVLYYCHRVATQLQLTNISYRIVSYHIIYHIIILEITELTVKCYMETVMLKLYNFTA
jgi:hypothetical protein